MLYRRAIWIAAVFLPGAWGQHEDRLLKSAKLGKKSKKTSKKTTAPTSEPSFEPSFEPSSRPSYDPELPEDVTLASFEGRNERGLRVFYALETKGEFCKGNGVIERWKKVPQSDTNVVVFNATSLDTGEVCCDDCEQRPLFTIQYTFPVPFDRGSNQYREDSIFSERDRQVVSYPVCESRSSCSINDATDPADRYCVEIADECKTPYTEAIDEYWRRLEANLPEFAAIPRTTDP